MFNQRIFSLFQVLAQAFFSFVFLSALINSGENIDYVDWSLSISIISAIYSFNIAKIYVDHFFFERYSFYFFFYS